MARPNYHQVRRQKELARKSRQQEKQQRRSVRAPVSTEDEKATEGEPVMEPSALSAVLEK